MDHRENLRFIGAQGQNHAPARLELPQQRLRWLVGRGGYQDLVVRRVLRPTSRPIADTKFQASVIGITMCQFAHTRYTDRYLSSGFIAENRSEREKNIEAVRREFVSALQTRVDNLDWRSTMTFGSLTDYLAREARSADLVITGSDGGASLFDSSRHVNLDDLVMRVGCPVLIVPLGWRNLNLDFVGIGWKDTWETRRAVTNALPILQKAGHVTVVEIAEKDEMTAIRSRLDNVIKWLRRHEVVAEPLMQIATGDDATRLLAIALELGACLIVAGAYGHSRARELVLGGVTRELLLRGKICSLVSH